MDALLQQVIEQMQALRADVDESDVVVVVPRSAVPWLVGGKGARTVYDVRQH